MSINIAKADAVVNKVDLDDPTSEISTAISGAATSVVAPIEPDNGVRAVGKGELVINIMDAPYGASPTADAATNTTAINAAMAYATANGGSVYVPPFAFVTNGITSTASGLTMYGAGRNKSKITSATADVFTIAGGSIMIRDLNFTASTGGVGHTFVVAPGTTLSQSHFNQCSFIQNNDGKSIWYFNDTLAKGGGFFDCHWSDIQFQHTLTGTVSGFYAYSNKNNFFSANRFTRCRVSNTGQPFFNIQLDMAGTYNYNNTWDTINFEVCDGGGFLLRGFNNAGIHNIGFFDNNAITQNLIEFGRNGTNNLSRGNRITNYHRSGGTLLNGSVDILLRSGQTAGNTTLEGISGTSTAGVIVDLGGGNATVIGYDPSYVTINNATASATVLSTAVNGITTPGLVVNGVKYSSGSGSPEGVVVGNTGDVYNRISGVGGQTASRLYVKETGTASNIGWKPANANLQFFPAELYGAIGDGITDDYNAIASAISDARAAGGKVILARGKTYAIGSSIQLSGANGGNISISGGGTLKVLAANVHQGVLIQNCSNVTIEDITIDMNKAVTSNAGSTNDQQGIYVSSTTTDVTGITIEDVSVINGWQRGIAVVASAGRAISDVRVERCTVNGVGDNGIHCAGIANADKTTPSTSQRYKIINNHVSSVGKAGIQVLALSYVDVSGNVLDGTGATGHGIVFSSTGSSWVTDFTCTKNKVTKFATNATWGLCISNSCTRFTLSDNQITACAGCVSVDVEDSNALGVLVDVAAVVKGNVIRGTLSSHGMNTRMYKNMTIVGNVFEGAALSGLAVSNALGATVSGNSFYHNTQYGLAILGVNAGTGGHTIGDNNYAGNTSGPITVAATPVSNSFAKSVWTPETWGAVGDGITNDSAAIVALLASGTTSVYLNNSKVYASSATLTIPSGVTVEGLGSATLKYIGASATRFVTMSANTVLRGATVDGNSLTTSQILWATAVDSVLIEKCVIKNGIAGDSIGFSSVTNSKVKDTTVDTCFMGVHIFGVSQYITLQDVHVKNWEQRGIYIAASTTQAPSDIDILHCLVTDLVTPSTHGATVREPIQCSGNATARIQNFRCEDSKVIGANKSYTDPTAPGTADQFNASYVDGLMMRNNISIFGGDCGFSGGQNTAQSHIGNYAAFNDTAGIAVGGTSGGSTGIVVSDNTLVNNHQNKNGDRLIGAGPGIYLYAAFNVLLTGNNCGDTQTTPTQAVGIASHNGCSNVKMVNNDATGTTFNKLFTDDGSGTNLVIEDTHLPNAPTTGTWVQGQRVVNAVPAVGQPKAWIFTTTGGLATKTWAQSTAYTAGDWVSNTSSHILLCLTSGTSGTGVNAVNGGAWGSIGNTIIDGTVTWVYMANATAVFVSEGNL